MTVKLSDIKPSPYNPKKPLTKKQYSALKRNVEKYGFQREVLVCRDFDHGGDGYICLDGHTALKLLHDLGKKEIECRLVETVTDLKSLQEFISGWAIQKKPLVQEIFSVLGDDFEDIFGQSSTFFDSDEKLSFDISGPDPVEQTQYFLTLPADCVRKLKNLTKTKAYKLDKYKAIADKIDSMEEERFLECLFSAIFNEGL